MSRPLMPKATALWLINHTCLTWEQIGQFCNLHPLELSVLVETNSLQELDPIFNAQLTKEEIARCEEDPDARLVLHTPYAVYEKSSKKYTPLSKRADIPHVILWMVRHYPHMSDHRICSFLTTTRTMVKNIREGKYWNIKNLTPKDPVSLGLCTGEYLQELVESDAADA